VRGAKTRLRRPANGGDSTPLGSLTDLYLVIQREVVIALMNVFAGSIAGQRLCDCCRVAFLTTRCATSRLVLSSSRPWVVVHW
jgi:hypothetical protein